ncbi:MAG: FAD-dependent oxidoreductase, partial [Anaerolineales bacterium]|nr:FAD-dependent oxidoreductase [Anaerolineales bacterium]
GGFTGLSAAYNIIKRFPDKKVVLLEGACCGYGASGRNGGFCITTSLLDWEQEDPEQRSKDLEVSSYGIKQIKTFISDFGAKCDFEESGMLEVAMNEKQSQVLDGYQIELSKFGLDSTLLFGKELEEVIKSPLFHSGIRLPFGAILNPAKLAREMKRIVEGLGVEIRERSVITRITPGKTNQVETELGDIQAPIMVVALNAYGHKIGFFKNRVFPVSVFQVATEPLSDKQWASIGWEERFGLSDFRKLFSYSVRTADGRIVIGGSDFTYYDFDALSSGNDKSVAAKIEKDLFSFFPQLDGLTIAHAWGGVTSYSLGRGAKVGTLGDDDNIFYATGFGEGVPSSQIAGRMIVDLMAKESNIFTNHFIVNRKIPYAGPRILRGGFGRAIKWMIKNLDYSPLHK